MPGSVSIWRFSVRRLGERATRSGSARNEVSHRRPATVPVRTLRRPLRKLGNRNPGGTVKYMMIVCSDPAISEEQAQGGMDIDSWVKEMDGRGVRLEGSPLYPASATTVRVRNDEVLIADGPFAETKEVMVGYDMLECADLDEAIEVASKHPLARRGAMELRPFAED
jgi:hypothetical protein